MTKEYGSSSQDSSDGLVIGGTYFLVNNLNGVSINTSSGKLTFGSDVPAGNYSLQILYYDNTLSPLYGYVVGTFNLTINKKSITVTSDNKTKLYGEENPTLTFEASGLVLSQTKSVISGGLKTSATNTSNVGTYSIDVDDTNPLTSQNYIITFVSGTLTINRATPTLGTLNLPNNKIYGDSSFTITNPTSESDGEWTYTNTDSTISISKDSTTKISTITINGATSGPITITGTQTETTNYNSGMVTATFSVGKRPLTITPMSHTIYYGENIPALTYASPTLVHGDIANTVITGSMTCTATNSSNVGSYSISVGTLTSNKYDITFITTSSVTILPKTITVTAANKTMEFGNTLPTLTWTVTGFNGTDNFITGSLSTAVTSSSVPGTYDIVKGSLALTSGNYQITAESFVKGTLTVTKATLTPSTLTFTNKKYLDAAFTFANPTLTTSYGDQVIKTINYTSSNSNIASISGNTITIIKPGTITITGNLTDNNYQMNQFTSSLTIEKLVPVVGSLVLPAKSFGNSPFSISNPDSSSSGSWSYTSSVPSVISVTNASTFSVNGIGDTTITATQATTEYYEQIIITGTLTVSKETPSIGTLLIPAKKFGDLPFDLTNPTSTSTGSWSYTSSNASVVTISGNTVTIIGVGDVNITATQASNANYNAASVSSTLSVGKGKLNITQSFSITNQVKPVTTATIPLPVLSIPSGHGGTWSFSSSNTEIAQISGTNVTILNKTGTVKITATLSADSKYLESTLFTQFSVSEGVASSFTYINKSSVISSITDTTLTGQTVDLKNKFDSNKINELNPSTGTTNEKMENRDLVVKSLFETFSSSQKIEVPKEVIYLPDSIKSFVTSSVTLINSSTSNSSSPTVVPATDITSSGAVFINTPDVGNSVRFDGTGPYAGSSIKITKQTNNYDIDKTNNSSPLPTVQMVKGDTIQFGGFIIVLGSITAIPYIPPLSSGSIPQTPMDIIWDKIKTGGDPIIQPLMGTSYALAPHIKYVNLLADYTNKIFINAQVDLLTIKDFPKKIYWDTSFSDISEVSHVYSNSYYRKFQITYNTETIEINADTLEIKQLTPIIKIKSGKFMPKTGLNSISFNKIYPKTNATKGLRIGLADYLITFVSDINTDDRHSIELLKTKKSNLNNICGALICKDQIIKISDLTGFELYQFNSSPFGEDINNVSLA